MRNTTKTDTARYRQSWVRGRMAKTILLYIQQQTENGVGKRQRTAEPLLHEENTQAPHNNPNPTEINPAPSAGQLSLVTPSPRRERGYCECTTYRYPCDFPCDTCRLLDLAITEAPHPLKANFLAQVGVIPGDILTVSVRNEVLQHFSIFEPAQMPAEKLKTSPYFPTVPLNPY